MFDFLLLFSITLSFLLLLMAISNIQLLEFKMTPNILLCMILFRLSLNVAATRFILFNGADQGTASLGWFIEAVERNMMNGNRWFGIFIFLIFFVITFIGIRTQQSHVQKVIVSDDIHFYETIHRVAQWIRWDAVASLILVFISIIGGMILGTIQSGKSISEAFDLYLFLALGGACMTQISALFTSTAVYLFIRSKHASKSILKQMTMMFVMHRKVIGVAALAMFILSMIPGFPHVFFLTLSVTCGATAYRMIQKQKNKTQGFEHAS